MSTSNCLSSCFLHAPAVDPFYARCNPFSNMDLPSGTEVIQTESLENCVVIFEKILPIEKEWKSNKITASCSFKDSNATLQVVFFPHRLHSNSDSSTVFCFTKQKSNSVSFSQSQCCRLLKLLFTGFSSDIDVVRVDQTRESDGNGA